MHKSIILLVALFENETWSFIPGEEQTLRISENSIKDNMQTYLLIKKSKLDEMCRTQKENEKYAEQSAIKTWS
jgi:hypothetical protein